MKEAAVVIIGAGPAGLVLAISLAKYKIHVNVHSETRGRLNNTY
jgi:flavin-dependent dehydrogenase